MSIYTEEWIVWVPSREVVLFGGSHFYPLILLNIGIAAVLIHKQYKITTKHVQKW